jgi:hypothetical protein
MLCSKYFQGGSPAVGPLALSDCHCHVGAEPTCTQRQRHQRQRIQYFLCLKAAAADASSDQSHSKHLNFSPHTWNECGCWDHRQSLFYSFFSFWNQRQIVATNFQALRASGAMERFF